MLDPSEASTFGSSKHEGGSGGAGGLPVLLEAWVKREESQLFCEAMVHTLQWEKKKDIESVAAAAYPALLGLQAPAAGSEAGE